MVFYLFYIDFQNCHDWMGIPHTDYGTNHPFFMKCRDEGSYSKQKSEEKNPWNYDWKDFNLGRYLKIKIFLQENFIGKIVN